MSNRKQYKIVETKDAEGRRCYQLAWYDPRVDCWRDPLPGIGYYYTRKAAQEAIREESEETS
ncbi:MAG: hypothetical protein WC565_08505 [Parcubacteria group bacterium]